MAATGARLMTDQDGTRAKPVAVGAVLRWQDHPTAIGTRHETPEAGHRQDRVFGSGRLIRTGLNNSASLVP